MPNRQIEAWLDLICGQLCGLHYRAGVRRELRDHVEDRMRLLLTQGMDEERAAAQAISTMGDPEVLVRALSESYHPVRRLRYWMQAAALWAMLAAALCYAVLYLLKNAG